MVERGTGVIVHGESAELDLLAWTSDAAGRPGRWLGPDEAVERWPGIRYGKRIFFHPLGGSLDTSAATAALRRGSSRVDGLEMRGGEQVTAIEARGDEWVEVRSDQGGYRARRVVVAAGVASARLTAGLVPVPPLFSVREEAVDFAAVRSGLEWPVVRHVLGGTQRAIGGFPASVRGVPCARGGLRARFEVSVVDDDGRSARRGDTRESTCRAWKPPRNPKPRAVTPSPGNRCSRGWARRWLWRGSPETSSRCCPWWVVRWPRCR
ncbi:FAD-dependent oxidoreductase [Amycolatopsis jiangsuensis]|uniref:Glycine/D-amino acid oxidase-like deaminating enzyme n=1 Tax=Amycolatopsis jiangsuensis TaxID=1181879 RepID=A0A840IPY3_9PSEU|nr:FAD-dependent oxidoreductase [Amycolatopsis jiangsuensis]MBB4683437.1 glycine/D-amino acid oxidase-like deaminating enzyme [Amycolatopsis jiangsuensis]